AAGAGHETGPGGDERKPTIARCDLEHVGNPDGTEVRMEIAPGHSCETQAARGTPNGVTQHQSECAETDQTQPHLRAGQARALTDPDASQPAEPILAHRPRGEHLIHGSTEESDR